MARCLYFFPSVARRAAIEAKADIPLTNDKDFLESGLRNPAIMILAEFLDLDRRTIS